LFIFVNLLLLSLVANIYCHQHLEAQLSNLSDMLIHRYITHGKWSVEEFSIWSVLSINFIRTCLTRVKQCMHTMQTIILKK
jgi:hypothetical protein